MSETPEGIPYSIAEARLVLKDHVMDAYHREIFTHLLERSEMVEARCEEAKERAVALRADLDKSTTLVHELLADMVAWGGEEDGVPDACDGFWRALVLLGGWVEKDDGGDGDGRKIFLPSAVVDLLQTRGWQRQLPLPVLRGPVESRARRVTQTELALPPPPPRRIIVGFSGGVTSAWCAGWALRTFPKEEVILLFHDTKREHPDTYRFLREMAARLDHPITERSDGRGLIELFRDEGYLGNNQNTFCSRMLKAEPCTRFVRDLQAAGFAVTKVFGYSAKEAARVARAVGHAAADGTSLRFPIIEEQVDKQECADWCQCEMGVRPSAMYEWSEHANCVGCVKGGRAYWLAVHQHHPDVFEEMARLEEEFGHEIIRGGDREHVTLRQLLQVGLKRQVNLREKITIGACECGD